MTFVDAEDIDKRSMSNWAEEFSEVCHEFVDENWNEADGITDKNLQEFLSYVEEKVSTDEILSFLILDFKNYKKVMGDLKKQMKLKALLKG